MLRDAERDGIVGLEAHDFLSEEACDRAVGRGVAREQKPDLEWNAEHPLPHRDGGKDMVDQVRGAVGHTPRDAGSTYAPPLAGERDGDPAAAASALRESEAAGEDAAIEESAELLLDVAWQRLVVGLAKPGEKSLEVFGHEPMEERLLGTAPLVARRRAVTDEELGRAPDARQR